MHREIKFRAKTFPKKGEDSFTGDWVFGNLIVISTGDCYIKNTKHEGRFGCGVGVIPPTVSQFTGLIDKKGIEVYEGDILRVGDNLLCKVFYMDENIQDVGDEIHAAFMGSFIDSAGCIKVIPIDSYFKNTCVVIGNMWDTPELYKSPDSEINLL